MAATTVEKRCFTPGTIIRSAISQQFIHVDKLCVGDKIVGRGGKLVEIIWACEHPSQPVRLVELVAATTRLTVTASHRIVVVSTNGEEEEICATAAEVGDMVIVGQTPTSLVEVRQLVRETVVIELGFENDAPVEAWPLPLEGGLITRGQAIGHVYDGLQECKEEEMNCETAVPSEDSGRRNRRSRRRYDKAKQAPWRQRTPSPDE